MKRIVIILIGLISVAYGQYSPTSAKSRFVNGIALGTKLDSYFAAADSNAIYWRADSALMAKYKGTARRVLFVSDSSTYFDKVVRTFGGQTIGGNKTFTSDIVVNGGLSIGRGNNSLQNVRVGGLSLISVTTGTSNTAISDGSLLAITTGTNNSGLGFSSLLQLTSGLRNVAIGDNTLRNITTTSDNTAIGHEAGRYIAASGSNTGASNGIYIGSGAAALAASGTNETVIGYNTIGNGSNTVTIGNSSVTDNYFSGRMFSTGNNRITKTDNSTFGIQFYDANKGWFVGYKSGDADSLFQINYDGAYNTSLRNPLAINKNGQVYFINSIGVNTTTPSRLLDLRSSSANGTAINIGNSATNGRNYVVGSNFVSGNGEFEIYDADAAATRIRVSSGGDITMPGVYAATVGATNRDVFVDNTGLIGYVSSFRASKKNIAPLSNTDWLHNLNPVTFNYRVKDSLGKYTDSAYKELEYGLVAEEVETVNKEMVFYDVDSSGNKKLRGVHYSKLIIPLLAEVKEHKKRIDAQDKVIEALLTRIKALEAKLN